MSNSMKKAQKKKEDADPEQIRKVYEEAGLAFGDKITKSIEEVLEFHKKVVSNRKDFLRTEIERLEKKIAERSAQIEELDSKRKDLMAVLKTEGALEEYTELQKNYQNKLSEFKEVSKGLEILRKIEKKTDPYKNREKYGYRKIQKRFRREIRTETGSNPDFQ